MIDERDENGTRAGQDLAAAVRDEGDVTIAIYMARRVAGVDEGEFCGELPLPEDYHEAPVFMPVSPDTLLSDIGVMNRPLDAAVWRGQSWMFTACAPDSRVSCSN